ncbi:BSD domain-containing protein 1-A,BSD domain-containing protein 1 [Mytilus coruscus]|uniref:BSD domain-containing protein 1-A,BSD domain-containing protein 1 n=1 Tax=Mytilus coruscus TaxID=42192 RepID=A0A6J8A4H7_MYTCO|nr:BSD domain-containing protein 1-A,BSD domain-containing protein 1 [Mytilus coruscus]
MAESSETSGEGGSWWGGWIQAAKEKSMYGIQAAKEKSMSAYEMIKKDLEEFSNTMSNDTGEAVAKTSESLRETLKTENTVAARDKLKQGLSSFLDGLTKLLVVEAEDKDVPVTRRKITDPIFDRAKARLHAIQVDPGTYCNDPTGSIDKYKEWLKSFDMEVRKGEVSELLVSQVEVRGLYTRLVPSEISHANFWRRYFYKVHQLQIDEARKLALMKRAEQSEKKEDSINWDEEEDSSAEEGETNTSKLKCVENKIQTNKVPSQNNGEQPPSTLVKTDSRIDSDIKDQTQESESVPNNDLPCDSDLQNNVDTPKSCLKKEVENFKSMDSETIGVSSKDNGTIGDSSKDNKTIGDSSLVLEEEVDKPTAASIPCESLHVEKDLEKNINTETENDLEKNINTKTENENVKPSEKENTNENDEIRTKEKGDTVVVNPDRDSPSTESTKESVDEDWERDFDVELTEEDMKAADEIAKKLNLSSTDYTKLSADVEDDWESWE